MPADKAGITGAHLIKAQDPTGNPLIEGDGAGGYTASPTILPETLNDLRLAIAEAKANDWNAARNIIDTSTLPFVAGTAAAGTGGADGLGSPYDHVHKSEGKDRYWSIPFVGTFTLGSTVSSVVVTSMIGSSVPPIASTETAAAGVFLDSLPPTVATGSRNRVTLLDSAGNPALFGSDEVWGRLSYTGTGPYAYTLNFYYDLGGVETACTLDADDYTATYVRMLDLYTLWTSTAYQDFLLAISGGGGVGGTGSTATYDAHFAQLLADVYETGSSWDPDGNPLFTTALQTQIEDDVADLAAHIAATGTSVHGLGTMSTQNATAVNIDGGDIAGITDLRVPDGGTGASTATGAFNNLSPLTTLGDVLYRGATDNVRLAGNTTATKKFLRQTGTGAVSAAPAWDTLAVGDIPTGIDHGTLAGLADDDHTGYLNEARADIWLEEAGTQALIDHTQIANIGTNTHTQIDTHLALAGLAGHAAGSGTAGYFAKFATATTVGNAHLLEDANHISTTLPLTALNAAGNELTLTTDDYNSYNRWMVGRHSRNQLWAANQKTGTTFNYSAGTLTPAVPTNILGGLATYSKNDGYYSAITVASTSDTVILELINASGLLSNYSKAEWFASCYCRVGFAYPRNIKIEMEYSGATGYQTIFDVTSYTSAHYLSDVFTLSGLSSPNLVTSIKFTLTNWSTTGSAMIGSIGIHHKGETPFPQYLQRMGGSFFGAITGPAGLVGTPTYSVYGDENTGVYFPAADQVGITAGGTQGALVTATALTVPQSLVVGTSTYGRRVRSAILTADAAFVASPIISLAHVPIQVDSHYVFNLYWEGLRLAVREGGSTLPGVTVNSDLLRATLTNQTEINEGDEYWYDYEW